MLNKNIFIVSSIHTIKRLSHIYDESVNWKELHEPSDNLTLVWAVDPDPATAPKHQSKLPLYPILPPDTWKSVALVEELQTN